CRNPGFLRSVYQHVFEPVGAVRDLLGNPVRHPFLHAAVPIWAKAEQRAVKRILGRCVVHKVTNMNDATAQRIVRHARRMRGRLHELNLVSFRILHLDVLASIACLGYIRRHFDTMCLEIPAHGVCIESVERCVIQTIDRRGTGWQWQYFYELSSAEGVANARWILRVLAFHRTQIVHIKAFCLCRIGRVNSKVRDAGNLRPLLTGCCRRQRQKARNQECRSYVHRWFSTFICRAIWSRPYKSSNWCARCLVNSLDGEHVLQSFLARSRRLFVVADAVGEMLCLDLELIRMSLRAHLLDRFSIGFAMQPETFVVKTGFHHQVSGFAVDREEAWSALTVRATARCDDA